MNNWNRVATLARWCLWGGVCIAYGLLQIWILVLDCWSFGESPLGKCFADFFYKDGVVLFFCSGLVASNAGEAWFKLKRLVSGRWGSGYAIIHIVVPALVLTFMAIVCYKILRGDPIGEDYRTFVVWIFAFSVLYSTGCRVQFD